jgi:diaminopimelate decarboxylase
MKTIDGQLFIENIPVIELAKEYGSPLFIYSSKEIEDNFLNYKNEIRDQDLVSKKYKCINENNTNWNLKSAIWL